MAGVGKSELAIQYLRYCLKKHKYRGYMWIRAESQESLLNEYALIAKALGLVEADETNFDIILNCLLKELNEVDDWLMVFDNLDRINLLHDKLPQQEGSRHVIITTRYGRTSRSLQAEVIDIQELSLVEAVNMFQSIYRYDSINSKERSALEDLMIEVGKLPLAILQSAGYLADEPMSILDYLQNYRKICDESIWTYRPQEDKFYEPVGITLMLTVNRIKDSETALHMLCLIAFLHPDDIPYSLWKVDPAFRDGILSCALANDNQLKETLRKLAAYQLIKRSEGSISIH